MKTASRVVRAGRVCGCLELCTRRTKYEAPEATAPTPPHGSRIAYKLHGQHVRLDIHTPTSTPSHSLGIDAVAVAVDVDVIGTVAVGTLIASV